MSLDRHPDCICHETTHGNKVCPVCGPHPSVLQAQLEADIAAKAAAIDKALEGVDPIPGMAEPAGKFIATWLQRGLKNMVTRDDIENWFTYHAPKGDQLARYVAIRDKAKELALLIETHTPACADQSAAIRKVREAVMTANAAIACQEGGGADCT